MRSSAPWFTRGFGPVITSPGNQVAEATSVAGAVVTAAVTTLVDNIGLPPSSINLTYNNTGVVGTQDGDVQIALRKRAVDPERIEQMVSKIVRELESAGENEVSSEAIGSYDPVSS